MLKASPEQTLSQLCSHSRLTVFIRTLAHLSRRLRPCTLTMHPLLRATLFSTLADPISMCTFYIVANRQTVFNLCHLQRHPGKQSLDTLVCTHAHLLTLGRLSVPSRFRSHCNLLRHTCHICANLLQPTAKAFHRLQVWASITVTAMQSSPKWLKTAVHQLVSFIHHPQDLRQRLHSRRYRKFQLEQF